VIALCGADRVNTEKRESAPQIRSVAFIISFDNTYAHGATAAFDPKRTLLVSAPAAAGLKRGHDVQLGEPFARYLIATSPVSVGADNCLSSPAPRRRCCAGTTDFDSSNDSLFHRRPNNRLRHDHILPIERRGWRAIQLVAHRQSLTHPPTENRIILAGQQAVGRKPVRRRLHA
jgi:hypothetical protein